MDRFVVIRKIRRFRDLLNGELDLAQRARLRKMLVKEENKLGTSLALLDDVESEISRCDLRIARQSARVASMERERIGVEQAKILLDCLKDSRNLHEWYRQKVLAQIETNKVFSALRGRLWRSGYRARASSGHGTGPFAPGRDPPRRIGADPQVYVGLSS